MANFQLVHSLPSLLTRQVSIIWRCWTPINQGRVKSRKKKKLSLLSYVQRCHTISFFKIFQYFITVHIIVNYTLLENFNFWAIKWYGRAVFAQQTKLFFRDLTHPRTFLLTRGAWSLAKKSLVCWATYSVAKLFYSLKNISIFHYNTL